MKNWPTAHVKIIRYDITELRPVVAALGGAAGRWAAEGIAEDHVVRDLMSLGEIAPGLACEGIHHAGTVAINVQSDASVSVWVADRGAGERLGEHVDRIRVQHVRVAHFATSGGAATAFEHHVVSLDEYVFVHGIGAHGRKVNECSVGCCVTTLLPVIAETVSVGVSPVCRAKGREKVSVQVSVEQTRPNDLPDIVDLIRRGQFPASRAGARGRGLVFWRSLVCREQCMEVNDPPGTGPDHGVLVSLPHVTGCHDGPPD